MRRRRITAWISALSLVVAFSFFGGPAQEAQAYPGVDSCTVALIIAGYYYDQYLFWCGEMDTYPGQGSDFCDGAWQQYEVARDAAILACSPTQG
jgi:hypothetical protein